MNKRLRQGKSSELIVAGELIRHGLDVYLPCVDDQAIDLVVRLERSDGLHFYDIQVKSVAGHNRIIGVSSPAKRPGNYILIIHYRHDGGEDKFIYLTRDQIARYHLEESEWGDLVFNKKEREIFAGQTLSNLAETLLAGRLKPLPSAYTIQHLAVRHVVWKLGDAISTAWPQWQEGEWAVDLLAPAEDRIIGTLYYDAYGELIASKSATYESVRQKADAESAAASAA